MSSEEFYSAMAASYDQDYRARGYEEDIPYYVDLARNQGGPVLEMGCGTGRVLIPIARAETDICGLDLSAPMLERLAHRLESEDDGVRRRISLVQGDMRHADFETEFRLITAPFRGIQHLVERRDQRAWLRNVARHLAPGGLLAFDAFQPDFGIVAQEESRQVDVDFVDPDTGRRHLRTSRVISHPETQTLDIELTWSSFEPDGSPGPEASRSGSCRLRWFTRAELENLLALEGFRIRSIWGNFDRTPHGAGAVHQIFEAERAG